MKTQIQQPEKVSHVIQSKTEASNQASVQQILQRYRDKTVQCKTLPEEDELLQGKFEKTLQRMEFDEDEKPVWQKAETETGLPDNLKSGVENLSGLSMDNVRVYYNSPKPAQLQALAYTQGTDIYVAPGQEKHLPHETWHVVQQMQGRVKPTMQLQGVNINDNAGLEHEADVMGGKVVQMIKIPWGNIREIKINNALENTGAQPANMVIPQYANANGTFHHIFPKSKLVRPLRRIEQVFIYFSEKKRNNANSKEISDLRNLRNFIIPVNNNANGYYWNIGTGFGGFIPQYRTDDPHDESEKNKPNSMDSAVFEQAKEERPTLFNKLADNIENDRLESGTIKNCHTVEQSLRRNNVHNTIQNDWVVKEGHTYGEQKKIYSIKVNSSSKKK